MLRYTKLNDPNRLFKMYIMYIYIDYIYVYIYNILYSSFHYYMSIFESMLLKTLYNILIYI